MIKKYSLKGEKKEGLTIRIEYSRNVICLVKMSRSVCTIWKL